MLGLLTQQVIMHTLKSEYKLGHMVLFKELSIPRFKRVVEVTDKDAGLHAFFAIHQIKPGPAMGGLRIKSYLSSQDALTDALRLALGMSYKAAFADIPYGGAKSIIMLKPGQKKTHTLLTAYARALNRFKGDYFCGIDMGTTIDDVNVILETSPYVAGLNEDNIRVDSSGYAAWGCFRGIQAIAQHLWKTPSLENKTIAIQGLGSVGYKLAEHLYWAGAKLIVTDTEASRVDKTVKQFEASAISLNTFMECECDILAPSAIGGIINDTTIPLLRCKAIGGAANNQLSKPENGKQLQNAGVLYAPDYVINAGGLINAAERLAEGKSYSARKSRHKVNTIYDKLLNLFNQSDRDHIATNSASDQIAEAQLAQYD